MGALLGDAVTLFRLLGSTKAGAAERDQGYTIGPRALHLVYVLLRFADCV